MRTLAIVTSVVVPWLTAVLAAQPATRSYAIGLPSASTYDIRSRDQDTVHAFLAVFVNGSRSGLAIWDGAGSDGTRAEGRQWGSGLHLLGTPAAPVVASTGPVGDNDTVEVVVQILNVLRPPSQAQYESMAERIRSTTCSESDTGSFWPCLFSQSADILDGLAVSGCDGIVAADLLVYTGAELEMQTDSGRVATVSRTYGATSAPAGCNQSIYGARVTMTRE
jgi:hypothetical protein